MKKKTLTFGDTTIVIAELNRAQVRELTSFGAEHSADEWEDRKWRTIMLSANNAMLPPTRENPLGSGEGSEDLQAQLGFASANELHAAVLELSGLRTGEAKSGESRAAAAAE
jgi:hypothetical protein